MRDDTDFWKAKLLAFLHDPPHKPLDIPGRSPRIAFANSRRW